MSDRICIHSNGTKNVRLSAEDMVSCCYFCGFNCMGGFPPMAWRHWVSSGIVSGGAYESNQVQSGFGNISITLYLLLIIYRGHKKEGSKWDIFHRAWTFTWGPQK